MAGIARPNDRLIVFVSSTMRELGDVRQIVASALEAAGIQPWVYETHAGPRTQGFVHTSLQEVEVADVYLGLFWKKYGDTTVQEYRRARELNKPCLVYIRNHGVRREKKLQEFLKDEVCDPIRGLSHDYFDNIADLQKRVADNVMAWLARTYRETTAAIKQAKVCEEELARLKAEVDRLRAATDVRLPKGSPLDYLAWQMRGWFDTLQYRFERHELRGKRFFEWVIRVPKRRGFDRILVHGIEGEAGVSDVAALRQAVRDQAADEGWLVAVRRVSAAARSEVEKAQSRGRLFCYTLDELLDEVADFTVYCKWLKAEVEERGIEDMYVPLAGIKEEYDPVTKETVATNRYDEVEGYLDLWREDPCKEHVSILGEFGTGKTWLALHYASRLLGEYEQRKKAGRERPRLPLVIPLRDYAKAVSAESLFSDFFFRKHEIPLPGYSAFEQLNRMGKLLLIFDGFDEMAARVDRQKMIENFWELARILVPGAKAIVTCRTEHFPDAREGRAVLNAELQAATQRLTGESPQFEVVELEKLSESQIRDVFGKREPDPEIVDRILANPDLMDLARRPLLIELILEAFDDVKAGKPVDLSRIYLYTLRRKMERDIAKGGTFGSLADKLYFLCEVCWEMLATDQMSLNYRAFPDRLRRLFPLLRDQKDLDHWRNDMAAQTMLTRNADGDYAAAHRSFAEFFAAYKLVAELGVLAPDFTELAQAQSNIDQTAEPRDYTWTSYFRRELNPDESVKIMPRLRAFITQDIDDLDSAWAPPEASASEAVLLETIMHSRARTGIVTVEKLPRNALSFAAAMVSNDPACHDKLCEIAWEKTGTLAWNALTLLPFLKYERSQTLAARLIERSAGGPLRSGVAWVLGELGVASDEVLEALKRTITHLAQGGAAASPAAWWESAFALEKLGALGPRKGRQGDEAISLLAANLPSGSTLEAAVDNLRRVVRATDPEEATINQCDLVVVVKHESQIQSAELFRDVLAAVDFSADPKGRRCYFVVWLCGHLGIRDSLQSILRAVRHPFSSVRNCATEALGKMGIRSPEVIEAIEDGLDDSYYRTRLHAAWSLGELGATASMPRLNAAIKVEEVRDVRQEMTRVRDCLAASAESPGAA